MHSPPTELPINIPSFKPPAEVRSYILCMYVGSLHSLVSLLARVVCLFCLLFGCATQWLSNHASSTIMSHCSIQWSRLHRWRHPRFGGRRYFGLGRNASLSIAIGLLEIALHNSQQLGLIINCHLENLSKSTSKRT